MALAPVIAAFQWGANGERMSPEEVARQRKILDALMGKTDTSPVGHWTQGAARMVDALGGVLEDRKLNAASTQNETDAARIRESLMGTLAGGGMASGGYPAAPMPASGAAPTAARPTMGDVATNRVVAAHSASALPGSFLSALDMHEGAGDYDTLFGHAQKNGPFAGTSVSSMPISDVLAFASPSGAYGQHVKGQVGRVATPMGRHQIVGTTLRNAVGELGIDPSTPFDAGTQDTIAAHLAQRRIASANSLPGKISALRSEWEGFKNVPDAQMAQIVADLEAMPMGGGAVGANEAMASGQMAGGPQIIDPGIIGGAASAPADPNIAPEWATNPNMGGGSPQGTGTPGEVRQGADGQTYMYAETTGMQGATGPMGWIPYNPEAGGAEPMAMQPAPPLNAPQTVQDMPVAQPQQQVAQALFPMEEMAGMNPQRMPAQTGVDPRIIEALSSPYVDDGTRRIAEALFSQQMTQQQAEQERMRAEQEARMQMQQRMQAAQAAGVDPRFIGDDEIWKAGVGQQFREDPSSVQEYEYGVQNPGYFQQQIDQKRAGATNVTTNVGEGDKFYENLDKKNAETFGALSESGVQARAKYSQIERLGSLLENAPQGAAAMLKQAAGEYGIATEGLSDIQAAQALINELVPQQRQPGSGPMSDADLALFKQSLPRLINQPEGNQLILETMRNITRYQVQMGDIADLVADREISPAEGRKMIREMSNPLDDFRERQSSFEAAPSAPDPNAIPAGWEDDWEYLTPEERQKVLGNG